MKKKVYLDTTIPSYYHDDRKETAFLIQTTRDWFHNKADDYDIYVSPATLVEASTGEYRKKRQVLTFITKWKSLPASPLLDQIVDAYISNHLMPRDLGGDALHLAYASLYKMDFLMTWNCDHLANANKRQQIRIINNRLGLYVPEIVTPLELQ